MHINCEPDIYKTHEDRIMLCHTTFPIFGEDTEVFVVEVLFSSIHTYYNYTTSTTTNNNSATIQGLHLYYRHATYFFFLKKGHKSRQQPEQSSTSTTVLWIHTVVRQQHASALSCSEPNDIHYFKNISRLLRSKNTFYIIPRWAQALKKIKSIPRCWSR